eukprot:2155771-Pyramimonas_sp.AAC.1
MTSELGGSRNVEGFHNCAVLIPLFRCLTTATTMVAELGHERTGGGRGHYGDSWCSRVFSQGRDRQKGQQRRRRTWGSWTASWGSSGAGGRWTWHPNEDADEVHSMDDSWDSWQKVSTPWHERSRDCSAPP